ncbi:MAG: CPBP family intramembrane metalloprotease [Chitinophagales bacterium]|nr:CPBP family intramembrane metalloprotease [Chitinophagales bacterium]
MKVILNYFKSYWEEQNKWHLLFVGVFLTISIVLNYKYDIENTVIDSHSETSIHFYLYFLLYAVSFIGIYLSYIYDRQGRNMLKQSGLWLRIFIALSIFSYYCYFYQYRAWIDDLHDDYYTSQILKICGDQFFQAIVMFLLIVLFWWIFDRKEQRLYGFKLKDSYTKVYLFMLLLMIPLVIVASFNIDFREYYPTVRRILRYTSETGHTAWYVALYEFCYGQEFFHTEFFFRGFLILAFVRYAGSRAILPAAVFYFFIHFGKPVGECISSFFGGLILGILSYRTQSISAGVMIHLGIAYLMEIVAGFWYWQS